MAIWVRQINDDHIRFLNRSYQLDGRYPDWVPTDHASINLTAVYAVEAREDTRGPFAYVFYTAAAAEARLPDLTLQLMPAERLIRALRRRVSTSGAPATPEADVLGLAVVPRAAWHTRLASTERGHARRTHRTSPVIRANLPSRRG